MVHKIEIEEKPEKTWIVWFGNMMTEQVGLNAEQIAKMVREGTISFETYKPDLIKITDEQDNLLFGDKFNGKWGVKE
jgi:hypothetical protein